MNDYGDSGGGYLALLAVFGLFLTIIGIAIYIVASWFLMKIFDKAGVQGRWRAWVPIYNTMVFSKLGDLSPWLILYGYGAAFVLNFVGLGWLGSLAAFAVTLLAAWRVGLKLQKEVPWVILYFFLPLIWLGILAFDKSRWNTAVPPAPWAANGFLADRTVWTGVPAQASGYAGPPAGYAAPGAYPPPAPGVYPPAPGAYPPPAGYEAAPAAYTQPPAYTPPLSP